MSYEPPSLARPTEAAERILVLDVLRGLALFGMFVVHFHMRSTEPGGLDDLVRTLVWRLVESKSHGTFALLFGAGFAIQMRRADERRRPFVRPYLRRLFVLALFGFATHGFFGFNVLLGYAAWGMVLLLVRNWSTRVLLVTACLSAASVPVYHLVSQRVVQIAAGPEAVEASAAARRATSVAVNGALRDAEARGSYGVLLSARLNHMAWFYTQPFFFLPNATLTLFIAGLLFVRHRVFERVSRHRRLLAGLASFGILAWLADNWLLSMANLRSYGVLRDQWLTFAYVSAALMLVARAPWLVDRLAPVASAGRMALTNYLLQVAALDLVFSAYAGGLREIRPSVGLVAACACFAAEAAFSSLWLRRFRLGPAEWVWRSLTYGRPQPMLRTPRPRVFETSIG